MRRLFAGLAAAVVAASTATAGEVTVAQKDKQFLPAALTVKAGDTVRFLNEDAVAHNVLAKGPSGDKSSGTQKPGEAVAIVFDKPGEHEVNCGIHPKMKMTIIVH